MKKKNCVAMLTVVFVFLLSNSVFAHYASVIVDNYHPDLGEEITVHIGWGHKFPGDGQMRREAYEKTNLEIIDPQGVKKSITIIPKEEQGNKTIKIKFEKSGIHTLLLTQKGFATKTTKGYKYKPKNQLNGVLHSKWSETVSKAVVNVGAFENEFTGKNTDDRFQVAPLQNPLTLDKGEFLPVRVTLDGKPWRGAIYATYSGFSDDEETFAYATKTDEQGLAKIKILEKGLWLVKTNYSYPYENQDESDEYSLKATLTFKN